MCAHIYILRYICVCVGLVVVYFLDSGLYVDENSRIRKIHIGRKVEGDLEIQEQVGWDSWDLFQQIS